jgi:quinol monooxygenase YgiN
MNATTRVIAITTVHGVAGRRDELRALMRETEARVISERGCQAYRFAATLEDPDEYLHVQEWADEAAFETHQQSKAFRAYRQRLFDLLARPSDMTIHHAALTVRPRPGEPMDPRSAD